MNSNQGFASIKQCSTIEDLDSLYSIFYNRIHILYDKIKYA